METKTRRATTEDIPWLVNQLSEFSKFYGTKIPIFPGAEEAEKGLVILMNNDDPIFISEIDGERTGFVCGFLGSHPFNSMITVLTELFWWVLPSHRGTNSASLLMDAFTNFGAQRANWTLFSRVEGKTQINERSLSRRGYNLQERVYMREN